CSSRGTTLRQPQVISSRELHTRTRAGASDVLEAVAVVIGPITGLSRLAGGVQGGAWKLQRRDAPPVVLKASPWMHGEHLNQLRDHAGEVVEAMVRVGYPTPRWIGTGATADHVWQLQEFVEGTPATALDERAVTRLLDIVETQAGRAR